MPGNDDDKKQAKEAAGCKRHIVDHSASLWGWQFGSKLLMPTMLIMKL